MKFSYELINHHAGLPVKMFIHNVNYAKYHWHKDIELVFVLDGEARFFIENQNYLLSQNDILLINSNTLHSSEYETPNLILVLQIDPQYFEHFYRGFSNILFDCKSIGSEESAKYNTIRKLLAEMMLVINRKQTAHYLKIQQLLFEFIIVLLKRYKRDEVYNSKKIIKNNEQLSQIIKYIDENYTSNITLNDLAKLCYMNESYFSSYFKKNIGISLTKYLAAIRLQNSITDLLKTDNNINEIALSNGFPNEKSYFKVFRERYGITPTQFRKKTIGIKDSQSISKNEGFNYFNYNKTKAFEKLISFTEVLEKEVSADYLEEHDELDTELKKIEVNVTHISGELKKSWSKLTTFGRAAEGLRAEWQKQLKEIQKDIPFEYIRFHGIFSDDMMVYNIDEAGNPVYNFRLIDQLFDFFMEVNIKPFVEIGFMPNALASHKDQTIFWWNANVSYPNDIAKWIGLVKEFLIHCIQRYGREEVRTWYFEIWNEPDLKEGFWYESDEAFFKFFKETFKAIKRIDPLLKTGGCGVTGANVDWNLKLLDFCLKENLSLDYISIHPYPAEPTDGQNKLFYKGQPVGKVKLSEKDFIRKTYMKVKEQLKSKGLENIEVHVTEWNSNVQWDYVNDTAFKASFLVKNVVDNDELVSSMGYWTFTDIFEEKWMSKNVFHGGFGFITANGLKKPMYHAYKLLNKLGNVIVSKGDGHIITKKDSNYQVLLYNYHHFDELYRHSDESRISYLKRYDVFENIHKEAVKLILHGLNGQYRINRYRLNQNHGSIFDAWLEMGAIEEMTKEDREYLEKISQVHLNSQYRNIADQYTDELKLEPHEVMLLEFNRIDERGV